jgi:hypothetical protein
VLDVVRLISLVTDEVAYPTFVRLVNAPHALGALGAQLLRFTRQNLIVLAPFLVFAALEADDLLALLYPPLPAAAATAARILCVVGALRTLVTGLADDVRFVTQGGSLGVSSEVAHFGLGARAQVDHLTVRWPDGTRQTVAGPIQADQVLEVKRP